MTPKVGPITTIIRESIPRPVRVLYPVVPKLCTNSGKCY